ncbi:MAG: hypothetical protein R2788_18915 [Saprospiraceae bacterium]
MQESLQRLRVRCGNDHMTIYATYQEVTDDHLARCPGEYVGHWIADSQHGNVYFG